METAVSLGAGALCIPVAAKCVAWLLEQTVGRLAQWRCRRKVAKWTRRYQYDRTHDNARELRYWQERERNGVR